MVSLVGSASNSGEFVTCVPNVGFNVMLDGDEKSEACNGDSEDVCCIRLELFSLCGRDAPSITGLPPSTLVVFDTRCKPISKMVGIFGIASLSFVKGSFTFASCVRGVVFGAVTFPILSASIVIARLLDGI